MTENGTIAFMTSTGGNGWEKEENKKYLLIYNRVVDKSFIYGYI